MGNVSLKKVSNVLSHCGSGPGSAAASVVKIKKLSSMAFCKKDKEDDEDKERNSMALCKNRY